MKSLVSLLFVLLVGLMLSCQLALDLDLPKQPGKLVVNSVISSDCVMVVSVSQSLDILDTLNFKSVSNALVTVSDEVGNTFNFTPLAEDYYAHRYRSALMPQPGKTYTLKVTAPGFESIESITRFPDLVGNIEVQVDLSAKQSYELPIQVKFSDNPAQRNYYESYLVQKLKRTFTYHDSQGQTITQYDTIWERTRIFYEYTDYFDFKSLFSDTYCNGKCSLNGTTQSYYAIDAEVLEAKVEVLNISPDYYEYLTTSHLQGSTYDDPTAQPVQPFNNIQNGYGIFAGYSRTYYKIK